MRAVCRAAGELASLFFFGGCTVTRQQYPESFGAECAAQCSHRPARPLRPFAGVYGGPRVVSGVSQGVADRPSNAVAVGVPLSSSASAFRAHPRPFRSHPRPFVRTLGRSTVTLGPACAPSALRAGGSFGRSAPDGGRFSLRLQFSLLRRHRPQSLPVIQSPTAAATAIRTPLAHRAHPRPFRSHPRRRPSARTLGHSARTLGHSARTRGPPRGREFRPIRTRWREISAEVAVFPPSASADQGHC